MAQGQQAHRTVLSILSVPGGLMGLRASPLRLHRAAGNAYLAPDEVHCLVRVHELVGGEDTVQEGTRLQAGGSVEADTTPNLHTRPRASPLPGSPTGCDGDEGSHRAPPGAV